jgi:HAD superfamily hydrolase (TIGR01490 family)
VPAAFFDVDGTLLTGTSLFSFLEYDLATRGRPPSDYADAFDGLRKNTEAGLPREENNRAYYRLFAGRDVAEVMAKGRDWFQAEYARGELFDPRVLMMLREHRLAGDLVVLLSGSFPPCLAPIARFTGADAVLCSTPFATDGRYTGEIPVPMIGRAKAEAASSFAASNGVRFEDCFAYGDHSSDAHLLSSVGNACVVGEDPVLAGHAGDNGWRRLPGYTAESALPHSQGDT